MNGTLRVAGCVAGAAAAVGCVAGETRLAAQPPVEAVMAPASASATVKCLCRITDRRSAAGAAYHRRLNFKATYSGTGPLQRLVMQPNETWGNAPRDEERTRRANHRQPRCCHWRNSNG